MVHLHRVLFNLRESEGMGYLVGEIPNNVEGWVEFIKSAKQGEIIPTWFRREALALNHFSPETAVTESVAVEAALLLFARQEIEKRFNERNGEHHPKPTKKEIILMTNPPLGTLSASSIR